MYAIMQSKQFLDLQIIFYFMAAFGISGFFRVYYLIYKDRVVGICVWLFCNNNTILV